MKSILAADDEIRIRMLYEEVLTEMGHSVRTVENGKEALEQFIKHRPDLVILDIKMPEMSGLEALEKIRKRDFDVPVLICSAYPRLNRDPAITTMNVFEFINKPIDLGDLRIKVEEALGGKETSLTKKETKIVGKSPKGREPGGELS